MYPVAKHARAMKNIEKEERERSSLNFKQERVERQSKSDFLLERSSN
jgi:hypothetical protein